MNNGSPNNTVKDNYITFETNAVDIPSWGKEDKQYIFPIFYNVGFIPASHVSRSESQTIEHTKYVLHKQLFLF